LKTGFVGVCRDQPQLRSRLRLAAAALSPDLTFASKIALKPAVP